MGNSMLLQLCWPLQQSSKQHNGYLFIVDMKEGSKRNTMVIMED
jgi:hypothetical protein